MTHDTRESWLIAVVQKLRSLFTDKGFEIPPIRISCSWPSRMIRKRIGECWCWGGRTFDVVNNLPSA
jgi:hypothetical protein